MATLIVSFYTFINIILWKCVILIDFYPSRNYLPVIKYVKMYHTYCNPFSIVLLYSHRLFTINWKMNNCIPPFFAVTLFSSLFLQFADLTLAVRRVLKTEQRSLNLVAFDNHPTCDLVVLSSFLKTILTHDTKGWKHSVNICVHSCSYADI